MKGVNLIAGEKGLRVNMYLTRPQVKALKGLSKKTGLTVSDIVRRAIDEYLKKYGGRGDVKFIFSKSKQKE